MKEHCDDNNINSVMEGLQPHPNLKSLGIRGFKGSRFPLRMVAKDHLMVLRNLAHLRLEKLGKCEQVPPLGGLVLSRVLRDGVLTQCETHCLESFYGLEHLDNARSSTCSSSREAKPINLFPKLSRFVLEDMESLEEWSDAMVPSNSSSSIKVFSNLWYLAIERLPSLAVLPGMENLTSLEELEIRRCGIVACIRNLNSLTSLESSSLEDCPALDASLDMKNPQFVHTLNISRCDELNTSLSNNLEKFTLLEWLTIFSDDPGCWAKGLQYLANLCELELGGFSDNLDYFPWPDSVTKDDGDSAKQHFFSLEKLELFGWPKITSLPDQIQHHSTLTVLETREFEGLDVLPEWIDSLQNL